MSLALIISSSGSQTLVRMPLFAAYLALLVSVAAGLRSELCGLYGQVSGANPHVALEGPSMPDPGRGREG